LPDKKGYEKMFGLFHKILSQKRNSHDKIYSLHEPEVQCIGKGKEHKKYEFGNKAYFIRSSSGIILAAVSFRNEYDGHTMEATLQQTERMTGRCIDNLAGDRGYGGIKQVGTT
ncbi:IS5/IS1182 family transposase, partial [Prevotella sp. OH937_COT-195]